jgi:hypothetical protein
MNRLILWLGVLVLLAASFALGARSVQVGAHPDTAKTGTGIETVQTGPANGLARNSPKENTKSAGRNLPVAQ